MDLKNPEDGIEQTATIRRLLRRRKRDVKIVTVQENSGRRRQLNYQIDEKARQPALCHRTKMPTQMSTICDQAKEQKMVKMRIRSKQQTEHRARRTVARLRYEASKGNH